MSDNKKALDLLEFLKEYNDLKNPFITEIECRDYKWIDNLKLYSRDEKDKVIFTLTKMERSKCPEPSNRIISWLEDGWDDFKKEVRIKEVEGSESFNEKLYRRFDFGIWSNERNKWVNNEKKAEEIEKIFNELYSIYEKMENDKELELFIGEGILYSNELKRIHHPILYKNIKIEFDKEEETIRLIDTFSPSQIYKDIFRYIDSYDFEKVEKFLSSLDIEKLSPYKKENNTKFFKELIKELSPNGEYRRSKENVELLENFPQIYRRQVLFLGNMKNKVNEYILNGIDKFSNGECENNFIGNAFNKGEKALDFRGVFYKENLFFKPKKERNPISLISNDKDDKEISIINDLLYNDGVLLNISKEKEEGKLISNLAEDLVSNGKRVLITGPKSGELLKKVEGNFNECFSSFIFNLLSNTSSSKSEEVLLNLNNKLESLDSKVLSKKIDSLQGERINLINDLINYEIEFRKEKLEKTRNIFLNNKEYTLEEGERFISNNTQKLKDVPTPIKLGKRFNLMEIEIRELDSLNKKISEEDEKIYSEILNIEELVSYDDFFKVVSFKEDISEEKLNFGIEFWDTNKIVDEKALKKILKELKASVDEIDLDNKFILEVIESSRDENSDWIELANEIDEIYSLDKSLEKFILNYNPKISDLSYLLDVEKTFDQIIDCYKKNGKIGFLKPIFNKDIGNLIGNCKINGRKPDSLNEFISLKKFYLFNKKKKSFMTNWNSKTVSLDYINLEHEEDLFSKKVKECIEKIKENFCWYKNRWGKVLSQLENEGFKTEDLDLEIDVSNDRYKNLKYIKEELSLELEEIIKAKIYKIELENINLNKKKLENILNLNDNSSEVIKSLKKAIREKDLESYKKYYNFIEEKKGLEKDILRRYRLIGKLEDIAPSWADEMRNRKDTFDIGKSYDYILDCWKFTQFKEAIRIKNNISLDEIKNDFEICKEKIKENTLNLKVNKAWFNLIENLNSLKEVKKENIPLSIMDLDKVVENFSIGKDNFDFVILVDGEMADILGVLPLYLGDKVIVTQRDEDLKLLKS